MIWFCENQESQGTQNHFILFSTRSFVLYDQLLKYVPDLDEKGVKSEVFAILPKTQYQPFHSVPPAAESVWTRGALAAIDCGVRKKVGLFLDVFLGFSHAAVCVNGEDPSEQKFI